MKTPQRSVALVAAALSRQLMIRKLRDEAKAQLGPKFDIKAFHDEILNGGAMPLDLLQERVERWIKEQGAAKS